MSRLILVFCVNAIVTYGLWYTTYRRYDLSWATDDPAHYIDLCHHLWDREIPPPNADGRMPVYSTRPLRYRILTPMLVEAAKYTHIQRLYDPGTSGRFRLEDRAQERGAARDPFPEEEYRQTVYYFVLIDYLQLLITSVLCFYLAYDIWHTPPYLAYAGSLIFMLMFYNLVLSLLPHVDAGAFLFIFLAVIAYWKKSYALFILSLVLGVLQKETVVLIVGLYLAVELLRGRRDALGWMAATVPAIAVYWSLTKVLPAGGHDEFYSASDWLKNLMRAFSPAFYTREFFFRHLLGNLPFFAALGAHLFLWRKGRKVDYPLVHLLMCPVLFALCMALDVNIGRVVGLGAVVYLIYELKVLEALFDYFGPGAPAAGRSPA